MDGQTKPMKTYNYVITVHVTNTAAIMSEVVTAKQMTTISKAFTSYSQSVDVYDNGEHIHSFELSCNEGIIDFAEAELEDLPFQGSEDDAAVIGAICKDILFIR